MQMGLALIAFVLSIPWKQIARSIGDATLTLWHKLRPEKEAHSKSKDLSPEKPADKESGKSGPSHTLKFDPASAITPALEEFQKAQCFFMLATNIAGLVVQRKGGLDPESFQQLYNTYIFIKVVAIGGYLPVTFGLLTLRMLDPVGWYLLALSIASVGVAIADLYYERSFSPSSKDLSFIQTQSLQGGPESCGGFNPIAWCYNGFRANGYGLGATNSDDGADVILGICLVTLALLTIEHFWKSPDGTNRTNGNFIFRPWLRWSNADRNRRWSTITRRLRKYVVPVLFTVFALVYLLCFAVFASDLNSFRVNKIYDRTWGFGQIVAVLVWAPPLMEYLRETFRKHLFVAQPGGITSPECRADFLRCRWHRGWI